MHLVLLAAGKGTRLPKEFRDLPKSMVNINGKTILNHNLNFYQKFEKKTIITGYKSQKLNIFIKKNKFNFVKNCEYKKTNMVHSLFKIRKIEANEIIICYSDIIFDPKIFQNLIRQKNKNIILLKKNWLKIWKGRMSYREILNDAENLQTRNNILVNIGGPIKKKLPKYQYMGIIKILKKDFFKLKNFYKKNNNKKIDFTSFINLAIKNNILKFNISITNKFWYEIDSINDIKFTKKHIW